VCGVVTFALDPIATAYDKPEVPLKPE